MADLVLGWRENSARGDWPLEAIHWAARLSGRTSWVVATLDPAEDSFPVWKVSYGGRGKQVPTVVEVAAYRRRFEWIERKVSPGASSRSVSSAAKRDRPQRRRAA